MLDLPLLHWLVHLLPHLPTTSEVMSGKLAQSGGVSGLADKPVNQSTTFLLQIPDLEPDRPIDLPVIQHYLRYLASQECLGRPGPEMGSFSELVLQSELDSAMRVCRCGQTALRTQCWEPDSFGQVQHQRWTKVKLQHRPTTGWALRGVSRVTHQKHPTSRGGKQLVRKFCCVL